MSSWRAPPILLSVRLCSWLGKDPEESIFASGSTSAISCSRRPMVVITGPLTCFMSFEIIIIN